MEEKERKTTTAQRKAIYNYDDKFERINCRLTSFRLIIIFTHARRFIASVSTRRPLAPVTIDANLSIVTIATFFTRLARIAIVVTTTESAACRNGN